MPTGKLLTILFVLASSQGLASSITYTSSAAFNAALTGVPTFVEDYATFSAKQEIAPGSTFDGITYASFDLTAGTNGIISSQFNSFSGLSLGANQSNDAAEFFFDADNFVINFAPTYATGVFYNVNANSGAFGITTSAGDATTGSAAYDTSTFVFAGLISTTPFTSAEIFSTSGGSGTASYNIPEIVLAPEQVPEPGSVTFAALGLALLAGLLLRRKAA
jgi:MYXO-CTERM domain-containing protein